MMSCMYMYMCADKDTDHFMYMWEYSLSVGKRILFHMQHPTVTILLTPSSLLPSPPLLSPSCPFPLLPNCLLPLPLSSPSSSATSLLPSISSYQSFMYSSMPQPAPPPQPTSSASPRPRRAAPPPVSQLFIAMCVSELYL